MQLFHHFLQHFLFWLLDSCLELIEFFKCMTWQSIFLLFFFFLFFFHDLSTLGNDVCHRWLSKLKHHFSCEDCFGFWLFGPKLFIPLLSTKRVMAQKYFQEMGNFLSMCLKTLIKVISKYHDLGILFCSLKRFGRFETVASLDAYPITKYQFFQNSSFFVAWFSKNSKRVFESGILRPIAWVDVIKRCIRFFKIVPLGAPKFSTDSKVKESICRDGFITNSNHQFF